MIINVITETVKNDLCIGCGACAAICPAGNLNIEFDSSGNYIVHSAGKCLEKCNLCLKVCPFGTSDYSKNEAVIAGEIFDNLNGKKYNEIIGYYRDLFVGHAEDKLRKLSSSGGLARFLLYKLLENKLVDGIINVTANSDPEKLFKFSIISDKEELLNTEKSVYYPVEMSEVLKFVINNEGKYAVTALPCFTKALREAQKLNKKLQERIKFIFGLTCGQAKSKYFTKYIASLGGIPLENHISRVTYRDKLKQIPVWNLHYNILSNNISTRIFWKDKISPVWCNRWFTPNSCNYCDDVFAELADISFMDAWLPEYSGDWKGTSIVISRSQFLSDLLTESNKNKEVNISDIPLESVINSQQGVIDFKRKTLAHRLYNAEKKGLIIPTKRVKPIKPNILSIKYLIMNIKENIRQKSFQYFYDKSCYNQIKFFEFIITIYELYFKIANKIKKILK